MTVHGITDVLMYAYEMTREEYYIHLEKSILEQKKRRFLRHV